MTPDIQPLEGDPTEPVTRGEFNEAMTSIHAAFGTVTGRIDSLDQRIGSLEGRMDSLEETINRRFDELFRHIDVAVEDRFVNLGAARSEEVQLVKEKQADHEQRITQLETVK